MKEIWKLFKEGFEVNNYNHKIYPPIYVSNLGNISGRSITLDSSGYYIFHYKNKIYRLHRVIAELFIPNNDLEKTYIDHINTIKTDNRVENLRWCTFKENCNNELTRKHLSDSKKNDINILVNFYLNVLPLAHDTNKRKIIQYSINNEFIQKWDSIQDAAKALNMKDKTGSTISKCCRGIRKTAYGYIWKYE